MFGDCLFIVDVPSSVEISYFMVILFYCYCSRGRLTNQGTNLGKVWNHPDRHRRSLIGSTTLSSTAIDGVITGPVAQPLAHSVFFTENLT